MAVIILAFCMAYADYIVNFEGVGEVKSAYASGNVNLSGLNWNLTEAVIVGTASDIMNGVRSTRIRGYNTTSVSMLQNKSNGIGTLSFLYKRYNTIDTQAQWIVEYTANNGATWTQVGANFLATDVVQTFSEEVNVAGDIRIRFRCNAINASNDRRINIDDITITDFINVQPLLSVNPATLSGFNYNVGTGPSLSQAFNLSGINLNPAAGNITISGSAAFEVSRDNVTFASTQIIPYTLAVLPATTAYIRLKAGLSGGDYNGESVICTGGNTSVTLTANGTVGIPSMPLTGSGYTENFASFISMATLPSGWYLSDTYTYLGTFGSGSSGGILGNGCLGIQLISTEPYDSLTATLTLDNDTGTTVTALEISYFGMLARDTLTGTPKWVVSVNGVVVPGLEYSTADGINASRSALVSGLNILPDQQIVIRWFTTSTGTIGTRRQIGFTNVSVSSSVQTNPQILTTGSFSTFSTDQGSVSAAQAYTLSSIDLTSPISLTAPTGFEISTDGGANYSATGSVSTAFNGTIYVRMTGADVGIIGGQIVHSSTGAPTVTLNVAGTVTANTGSNATDLIISEYVEGSSYNKAIEIFNGTGAAVNLAGYSIRKQTNGAGGFDDLLNLTGTLADRDVYVVVSSTVGGTNLVGSAYVDLATTAAAMSFNGNDATALFKNGVMIDLVGYVDNTEFWGRDVTMVRNASISTPTLTYSPADWTSYPVDTFSYLGSHQFNGTSTTVTAPTIQSSALVMYPGDTSIVAEWTPGNGAKRLVKMNTANSFTNPVDGTDPAVNTVYSGSGEQVIYNGASQIIEGSVFNGVTVTGLATQTTYWLRVYEYNGSGTTTKYTTVTAVNNPRSATTTHTVSNGYYTGITGYGASLKASLHTLIRTTHTTRYSYDALWTQLPYTDEDPNNTSNVIELYTGWSVPKTNYGGAVTEWNREHTWSKSHGDFGETAPAGTDLHHLRPADVTVNSAKGNKDFDNGGTLYTDASPYTGYPGATGCYTSTYTWEPRPEDKGDVARMIMYMAVRYEGTDTSYNLEIVDATNTSGPNYGKLSTLLQWHVSDPPDAREMQRNNRIQERQGNRNPFIDSPQYAQYIWTPVPTAATNISSTGFTVNWSTPITATKYYLDVATDSNFTGFVSGYSNYDAGLTTSKSITGLSPNTTYYYRLRSYFTSGVSMYSPVGSVSLVSAGTVGISADALNEGNLQQRPLTVTLTNCTFADAILLPVNFILNNAPSGVSIGNLTYTNSTHATITLSFDGTDFDTNISNFSVSINAVELSPAVTLSSNVLPITAYVESPLTASIQGNDIVLDITTVSGATTYKVFAADTPAGPFTEVTSSGSFTIPTRWNFGPVVQRAKFYQAVGIR